MDRGAQRATVRGVTKSRTRLSEYSCKLLTRDAKDTHLNWSGRCSGRSGRSWSGGEARTEHLRPVGLSWIKKFI